MRRTATFAFLSFLAATAHGAEFRPHTPLGAWCPKQENIQTAALFEPTHVVLPSGDVCRYKSTIGTWGNFLAEAGCTYLPDGSRVSITWIGDTIRFSGSIPRTDGEFKDAPIDVTLQRCLDDEPIFVAD